MKDNPQISVQIGTYLLNDVEILIFIINKSKSNQAILTILCHSNAHYRYSI